MDRFTIEGEWPSEIDGTPAEAAEAAAEQLVALAPAIERLVNETATLLDNVALDWHVTDRKPGNVGLTPVTASAGRLRRLSRALPNASAIARDCLAGGRKARLGRPE